MMTKIIQIDNSLRLVPYFLADHHDAALAWYQDMDLVELVDGVRSPYSVKKLNAMYSNNRSKQSGFLFVVQDSFTKEMIVKFSNKISLKIKFFSCIWNRIVYNRKVCEKHTCGR